MTNFKTSMLDSCSSVRMTASRAATAFASAKPVAPSQMTSHHLDMLQMSDIDLRTRAYLPIAEDCIRDGLFTDPSVIHCMDEYNARCGK